MKQLLLRAAGASLLLVLGLCAAYLGGHPPVPGSGYPGCLLHQFTGLYCPGCGSTRAAYALLHGDLSMALHQNALFVLLVPLWLYSIYRLLAFVATGAWNPPSVRGTKVSMAVAAVVLGFGVARNLPVQPFTSLAPIRLDR